MIHYLIQTIAFQLLFLIVYDLFLKKETFFTWNRTYLLVTPVLSLLLPFVQIESIRETIPAEYVVQLPAVILGNNSAEISATSANQGFQLSIWAIWIAGAIGSLLIFGYKLLKIKTLSKGVEVQQISNLRIKSIPDSNTAFTFFNTIYLGANLSEAQKQHILQHEEIHVCQGHTWDLIVFELLRILFWFNPLVYIFQKRVGALHEFTADRKVALNLEKTEYYQRLLSQVFQTEKISFINTFFNHSLIKNRIVMLQKSKSKRTQQLKYLLLLPLVFGMLIYTSCAQEADVKKDESHNEFTMGSDSDIVNDIEALKRSIAEKGEMTDEEKKALKELYRHASGNEDAMHFGSIDFSSIEKVPVYPGCEGMSNEAAKKCFVEKVSSFVVNNFNSKKFSGSSITGKQRIVVHFVIGDDGVIKDVKAKAQYHLLADEAKRVVKLLPDMEAGTQDGKKVNVQFALPIIFTFD